MKAARSGSLSSLRTRFLLIFGALAILPLVGVALILSQWTFDSLESQSITLQGEVASRVGAQVGSMLAARETELAMLDDVLGIGSMEPDDQHLMLSGLLAHEPMYREMAIVDLGAIEVMRLSHDAVVLDTDLRSRVTDIAYTLAVDTRTTHFGSVSFDSELREPLITIAHPLIDPRSGKLASVLMATVSFKPIWELLESIALSDQREVYVVNTAGDVVAHRDPTLVLSGEVIPMPIEDGHAVGLSGEDSIVSAHSIVLGEQDLVAVAEQPRAVALAVARRAQRVTIGVTALALLAVFGAVVLVTRRVVRPIERVAAAAGKVAEGDLSQRAPVTGTDEVGNLAEAFNQMTVQLSDLIDTLEQRVADRTHELARAGEHQRELIKKLEAQNAEMTIIQEQLEDLMRSKSEFLASVSHELRTPLTSVLGFSELLRDGYHTFSEEEQLEMISRISVEGTDMANIVNDLLVAAREEGGSLVVEPVAVDVVENVQAVVDLLANASVDLQTLEVATVALADPVRLRQILRNLVVNAVRYGGDDIAVSISRADARVQVEVRDDGEGVPADQWELIFDAYRRAETSRVNPSSVGLGLSVSRTLARRMEGELSYRYEGDTSIFTLTLPSCTESGDDSTTSAPSSLVEVTGG